MDAPFWFKLGLSFLVGGVWVTLATITAEQYGSKVGGLIGGLPSTVIVALFFIGLTQTPSVAVNATIIIPLSMSVNGLFMLAFLYVVSHGLGAGLLGALFVWVSLASLLIAFDIQVFWVSILIWLLLASCSYWVVERKMKISSRSGLAMHYSATQIGYRALFGGTVIAFAVLAGKLGGPLLGGVFATFPAMFVSTLVIAYRSGGMDFSRAVGKSLLVSGIINVPLYAFAVRSLYPLLGLVLGTVSAILFSLGTGYLTYRFVLTKIS